MARHKHPPRSSVAVNDKSEAPAAAGNDAEPEGDLGNEDSDSNVDNETNTAEEKADEKNAAGVASVEEKNVAGVASVEEDEGSNEETKEVTEEEDGNMRATDEEPIIKQLIAQAQKDKDSVNTLVAEDELKQKKAKEAETAASAETIKPKRKYVRKNKAEDKGANEPSTPKKPRVTSRNNNTEKANGTISVTNNLDNIVLTEIKKTIATTAMSPAINKASKINKSGVIKKKNLAVVEMPVATERADEHAASPRRSTRRKEISVQDIFNNVGGKILEDTLNSEDGSDSDDKSTDTDKKPAAKVSTTNNISKAAKDKQKNTVKKPTKAQLAKLASAAKKEEKAADNRKKKAAKAAAKQETKEVAELKKLEAADLKELQKSSPNATMLDKAVVSKELAAEIDQHRNQARTLFGNYASDDSALSSVYLNNDESDSETEVNNSVTYKPMCAECGCRPCCLKTALPFFHALLLDLDQHEDLFPTADLSIDDQLTHMRYHMLRSYQCTQTGVSNFTTKLPIEPCIILGIRKYCPNSNNEYNLAMEQLPKKK